MQGERNISQTLKSWESAANAGHTEAAYKGGKLYLTIGTNKKDEEAVTKARLYLEKAGPNHANALYLLALTQEKGIGCQPNAEAMEIYTQAAKAGDASAQFKLGTFFEMTLEPEDAKRAFSYYKLAAQQGHVDARGALVKLYRTGRGTPKDLNEADSYLNGLIHPFVFKEKKELLQEGHKAALAWFENKASEGNSSAQQYLGKLLEIGKLAEVNVSLAPGSLPQTLQGITGAIALYKQAAIQGKQSAQRRLRDFKQSYLFEAFNLKPHTHKTSQD